MNFCLERCECQPPQRAMCANRGLRTVPQPAAEASNYTLSLNLGGNFITNISALDFTRYNNLIRLNLQYNQVETVHPNAFEKLTRLEELYLGHNLLSALPVGTLQPLKKLTVLYGNNNAIKKITPNLFTDLHNLVKLRLDGNFLEVLQDSVFESLTSLHFLHLEHNKVQHIHRKAFSKLTSLRYLNLAHNKQSGLPTLTFSHLRALTTLLLSENEIQYIGNHVFQNLQKLSKLSLSNNRISQMDSEALKGLLSLRELLIDGNDLAEIPAGLLDPLKRIEELDLSSNRISHIDSLAFSKLKHLKVLKLKNNFLTSLSGGNFALNKVLFDLDLQGNNWTCDCRLNELKRWMAAVQSQGKLLTVFLQCRYPATLRGKYLDYVNSSQLQSLGNLSHLCKSEAGPEESRGGGVVLKMEETGRGDLHGAMVGEWRGRANKTEVGERDNWRPWRRERVMRTRGEEKRKRERGVQGDQSGIEMIENSYVLKGKKPKNSKHGTGRRKLKVPSKSDPTADPGLFTNSSVPSGGTFDLLRSDQHEIADPCVFNHHFIYNVSVAHITSSTVTVFWTTRDHHHSVQTPRTSREVHYRVMFDRFGTADRFPRYVYTQGTARSVTLRELSAGVTYMVCVEGVVGGLVCQVAPRDHCAGLVTLSEGINRGAMLTSDLQLVTLATLAGNALLLLVIGGVWLGRFLRKRLRRRKSAVHVRHMYSTRRPFRPAMATASVSADFTTYQSSRPARLSPIEEGDLIEFPCDRFLDSCSVHRGSDMQRFTD